jgi:hypothetical protein
MEINTSSALPSQSVNSAVTASQPVNSTVTGSQPNEAQADIASDCPTNTTIATSSSATLERAGADAAVEPAFEVPDEVKDLFSTWHANQSTHRKAYYWPLFQKHTQHNTVYFCLKCHPSEAHIQAKLGSIPCKVPTFETHLLKTWF